MKVLVEEISNILAGIDALPEVPVKPSYWLARIKNKLSSELRAIEKVRLDLVKKYSEKDAKGNIVRNEKTGQPKSIDRDAFNKEYLELLEQEIEIDFQPIKLDTLKLEKVKPDILAKLEKIIVE